MESMRAFEGEGQNCSQPAPPVVRSGLVGRPRFDIPQSQLTELVESGFTGVQIASVVGVSLSTVRRRIAEYGLSDLSDESLDE